MEDPLQAEAKAILLGSKITKALNMSTMVLLSDRQLLINALNSSDPIQEAPDYRIRPTPS